MRIISNKEYKKLKRAYKKLKRMEKEQELQVFVPPEIVEEMRRQLSLSDKEQADE